MTTKSAVVIMLMIFFFSFDSVVLAHVPHDVVVDLETSPAFSRDKTIFAIVYWKLFRSIDGGYEWHRQSRGLCSHGLISLVISPTFSIDKTLFVSCIKGEVYRSQDAGRSWTLSSNGLANLSFVSLVISPRFGTDHTILALGSQGGIYQTKDAGENWKRVFHQELDITAVDWAGELVVFGTGSGELYVSENSGTKWKKCGQHPNSQKITCIELPRGFSSDEPFFIGAGKEGVFRVINGGSTFQDGSSGMSGKYITSLASFYENDRLILFASTWKEAIFRSEDAGTTWKKHGSGLMKSEQAIRYLEPHFKKIVISDDLIFFLGGFCGVFRSDDRGQTWLKLETLLHHITGLDLSPPTDSGFTIGIATYGGGAYSTSDGGVSWKINNCGLIYPRLGPIVYSPNYAKDRTVFTATYGYIMKSSDGGAHWSTISLEPPKISIEGVKNRIKRVLSGSSLTLSERISLLRFNLWTDTEVVIPIVFAISPGFSVDQTVFVGMYPNGLLRSQDGGYTFSLIWDTFDSRFRSLVVSPEYPTDHTLFASLKNGLYRSLDAGSSWGQIGSDFDFEGAVLAISPHYGLDHTLFVGASSGLFRTRDGGETWKKLQIFDDDMNMPIGGLSISPYFATDRQILVQVKGGELFLCRDHGDRFEAVPSESADSGYEFSPVLGRDNAPLMKFSPNYNEDRTIYAALIHQLVKSTDGGRSWVEIPKSPIRYESEASLMKGLFLPIVLEGQWKKEHSKEFSASGIICSDEPGSEVTLRFVGTGVKWIGTHGPDRGVASVFIDGTFQKKVDQYSGDRKVLVESFSKTGLPYGSHMITIKVDGLRNENSSGSPIYIDAFDVIR